MVEFPDETVFQYNLKYFSSTIDVFDNSLVYISFMFEY